MDADQPPRHLTEAQIRRVDWDRVVRRVMTRYIEQSQSILPVETNLDNFGYQEESCHFLRVVFRFIQSSNTFLNTRGSNLTHSRYFYTI